ncbi:MAG: AAA family ATPase, partial [Acidimicrobiales bacterium]
MNGAGHRLVGRATELEQARRAVTSGRSCLLLGPPGIGKSTLLHAVVAGIATLEWSPVAHGLEILSSTPLAPWQGLLDRHRTRHDDDEELAHKVAVALGNRVLLVDDVQWFDSQSRHVLDLVSTSHVVLLAGRTPTAQYEPHLPNVFASANIIELPPLSGPDAVALVRQLRPGASSADVTRIVNHGGGNPLFTEFSAMGGEDAAAAHPIAAAVARVRPEHHDSLALLAAAETEVARDHVRHHRPLVDRGLVVQPTERTLRIAHACVAEAARDVLSADTMARAHLRLASMTHDPLRCARHLLHAGQPEAAREAAVGAAQRTSSRAERAALLALAVAADPDSAPQLVVEAAEALVDAGRCDQGVDLARQAPPCADPDLERRRLTALARG